MAAEAWSGMQAKVIVFFSFVNNVVETCSYSFELSRNTEIKHLFNSKGYFHVLDIFYKIRLRAFNSTLKLKKFIWIKVQFICLYVK